MPDIQEFKNIEDERLGRYTPDGVIYPKVDIYGAPVQPGEPRTTYAVGSVFFALLPARYLSLAELQAIDAATKVLNSLPVPAAPNDSEAPLLTVELLNLGSPEKPKKARG